jgi:hypothetical protein
MKRPVGGAKRNPSGIYVPEAHHNAGKGLFFDQATVSLYFVCR